MNCHGKSFVISQLMVQCLAASPRCDASHRGPRTAPLLWPPDRASLFQDLLSRKRRRNSEQAPWPGVAWRGSGPQPTSWTLRAANLKRERERERAIRKACRHAAARAPPRPCDVQHPAVVVWSAPSGTQRCQAGGRCLITQVNLVSGTRALTRGTESVNAGDGLAAAATLSQLSAAVTQPRQGQRCSRCSHSSSSSSSSSSRSSSNGSSGGSNGCSSAGLGRRVSEAAPPRRYNCGQTAHTAAAATAPPPKRCCYAAAINLHNKPSAGTQRATERRARRPKHSGVAAMTNCRGEGVGGVEDKAGCAPRVICTGPVHELPPRWGLKKDGKPERAAGSSVS